MSLVQFSGFQCENKKLTGDYDNSTKLSNLRIKKIGDYFIQLHSLHLSSTSTPIATCDLSHWGPINSVVLALIYMAARVTIMGAAQRDKWVIIYHWVTGKQQHMFMCKKITKSLSIFKKKKKSESKNGSKNGQTHPDRSECRPCPCSCSHYSNAWLTGLFFPCSYPEPGQEFTVIDGCVCSLSGALIDLTLQHKRLKIAATVRLAVSHSLVI